MPIPQTLKQKTPLANIVEPIHDAYMGEPYDKERIASGAVAIAEVGKHYEWMLHLMHNVAKGPGNNDEKLKTLLKDCVERLPKNLVALKINIDEETAEKVAARMGKDIQRGFNLGSMGLAGN